MEPEKKSNGALVGAIVIILILIIGGIYIWKERERALEVDYQSETITDQDSAALNALEEELGETDTNVGVDINTVN